MDLTGIITRTAEATVTEVVTGIRGVTATSPTGEMTAGTGIGIVMVGDETGAEIVEADETMTAIGITDGADGMIVAFK
jgi:hypothetical protein